MNMPIKKDLKKAEKEVEKIKDNLIKNEFKETGEKVGKISEEFINALIPFNQYKKKRKLTLGQRTADALTKWAGSWIFIIGFLVFITFWMIINTVWLIFGSSWDIYPFILLNLILSCLAAIQAPIILMSQNRANQRDRLRAEYDYQVNVKAEKEIQEIQKQLNRVEKKLK